MGSSLSATSPSFFPIHDSKGSSLSATPPSFFPLCNSKVSFLSTASKEEQSPRHRVSPPNSVFLRFGCNFSWFLESFTTMNSTSLNHLEFDYLFKLLLSGNSRVVKSNHLLRFTSDSFKDIFPTIGSLLVLVVDPFSLFGN
ncbi:hypothetical protein ZIOFF_048332 [Zingiber officinale]|uniref:Uncharacterized protein n=1 Tax=Zingiber officinale TaxID=94328 RepID=A0A8J5FUX2_ZINOF|nr:hypothetical protein ZIOFF_048332 [Zingiber officinale]